MAKIRVAIAITLDGYLPAKTETLMQWMKTDRQGFPYWRERCTTSLFSHYPFIDLICHKERQDNSYVYYAEIMDQDSIELCKGLFLYNIIDELVVYVLPVTVGNGVIWENKSNKSSCWKLKKMKGYKNGICCMIYCKSV